MIKNIDHLGDKYQNQMISSSDHLGDKYTLQMMVNTDHIGHKYKLQMIRNTDHLGEGQEDPLYLFPHKATPTKGYGENEDEDYGTKIKHICPHLSIKSEGDNGDKTKKVEPCILFVAVLHQLGPSRLQAYNDDKDDSESGVDVD